MIDRELNTTSKEMKRSKGIFLQAFHLAKLPIILSFFLTPIRFLLELAGLPDSAIFLLGLLWLSLAFSVYWGIKLHEKKRSLLLLLLSLVIFSPVSRLTVVAAWWVDTNWEIGTHYADYFESWSAVLLNQVAYGSLVQIIPGFFLGALTLAIQRSRNSK